jgi:hypothetical protein
MSYTVENTTKYLLPAYECALISTFLDGEEGNFFRKATGDVEIKEVRDGRTYKNGALHSFNDIPAINNGMEKAWYKDGLLHREGDKPALIDFEFGISLNSYYINGKLHRDGDNPAVESQSFNKWFRHGVLHRDGDLPAVVDDFQYEWWVNGKRHRDGDKPAYDDERTETKQWWVYGVLIRSYFGGDDDISYTNEVNQKWDNDW